MIMGLLNNKELLYLTIGLLAVLFVVLLIVIIKAGKVKNAKNDSVKSLKIETPEYEESDEEKSDIEQMLAQMQQDIETRDADDVRKFEDEQEEKSIISYKELLKANKKDYEETPTEEIEAPDELDHKEVKYEPSKTKEEVARKFKNTDFISPIYGRLDSTANYPTIPSFKSKEFEEEPEISNIVEFDKKTITNVEFEKTFNLKPLREEIKKNDEFLNMLKEFRKNLE